MWPGGKPYDIFKFMKNSLKQCCLKFVNSKWRHWGNLVIMGQTESGILSASVVSVSGLETRMEQGFPTLFPWDLFKQYTCHAAEGKGLRKHTRSLWCSLFTHLCIVTRTHRKILTRPKKDHWSPRVTGHEKLPSWWRKDYCLASGNQDQDNVYYIWWKYPYVFWNICFKNLPLWLAQCISFSKLNRKRKWMHHNAVLCLFIANHMVSNNKYKELKEEKTV